MPMWVLTCSACGEFRRRWSPLSAKLLEKEFSAVTAVYAAEVIVHGVSEEPGADSPAYSEFDLEYLEGLGLADRLPEWITLFTALEEDAA